MSRGKPGGVWKALPGGQGWVDLVPFTSRELNPKSPCSGDCRRVRALPAPPPPQHLDLPANLSASLPCPLDPAEGTGVQGLKL